MTFSRLKKSFVSAQILCLPEQTNHCIVKVSASNTGVGAVLSQCSGKENKIDPTAYLSHKISPVERNYSIVD